MIASTNAGRVFGDPSASQVGCAMVSDSWLVSDAELLVGIALQRIASSGAASTAALRMDRRSVSTQLPRCGACQSEGVGTDAPRRRRRHCDSIDTIRETDPVAVPVLRVRYLH